MCFRKIQETDQHWPLNQFSLKNKFWIEWFREMPQYWFENGLYSTKLNWNSLL